MKNLKNTLKNKLPFNFVQPLPTSSPRHLPNLGLADFYRPGEILPQAVAQGQRVLANKTKANLLNLLNNAAKTSNSLKPVVTFGL